MAETTKRGPLKETIATILTGMVSLSCVIAALVRVAVVKAPDQEVLLFLVTAVLVQFLDRVSKFKFGSFEFEKEVKEEVEDLRGRLRELAELSEANEAGGGREASAPPSLPARPQGEGGRSSEAPAPAARASLDEAAQAIAADIYRPGLTWEDDPVGDYFTCSEVEGLRLTATVGRSRNYQGRYLVMVKLEITDERRLDDPRAVFFLHHTYRRQMRFEAIVDDTATLTFTARGAFVLGAIVADGSMLRLDLADATLDLGPEAREDFLSH